MISILNDTFSESCRRDLSNNTLFRGGIHFRVECRGLKIGPRGVLSCVTYGTDVPVSMLFPTEKDTKLLSCAPKTRGMGPEETSKPESPQSGRQQCATYVIFGQKKVVEHCCRSKSEGW